MVGPHDPDLSYKSPADRVFRILHLQGMIEKPPQRGLGPAGPPQKILVDSGHPFGFGLVRLSEDICLIGYVAAHAHTFCCCQHHNSATALKFGPEVYMLSCFSEYTALRKALCFARKDVRRPCPNFPR